MVKKPDPLAAYYEDRPSVVVPLQQPAPPPAVVAPPEPRARAVDTSVSITMHQTNEVRKLMRQVAYETEISREDLYAIALNLMFRAFGKPLAAIYRDPASGQVVAKLAAKTPDAAAG